MKTIRKCILVGGALELINPLRVQDNVSSMAQVYKLNFPGQLFLEVNGKLYCAAVKSLYIHFEWKSYTVLVAVMMCCFHACRKLPWLCISHGFQ